MQNVLCIVLKQTYCKVSGNTWHDSHLIQDSGCPQRKGDCYSRGECCSVATSCPTLCNPTDCSMPGFLVLHYLLEFAQVGDCIQPSHPLSPPSLSTLNLSQNQGLFQWRGEQRGLGLQVDDVLFHFFIQLRSLFTGFIESLTNFYVLHIFLKKEQTSNIKFQAHEKLDAECWTGGKADLWKGSLYMVTSCRETSWLSSGGG